MALANTRDPEKSAIQLRDWLSTKLPGATEVAVTDVDIPQASGMSNETLMFNASWTDESGSHRAQYVARVAPQGPGVFPRYDLVTEQRVLHALSQHTDAPVPATPWVETNTDVLGSHFLVMERLSGRIAADDPPFTATGWVLDELNPAQRATMCDNALIALTKVHAADHKALGLDFLDHPELGATPLDQSIADWRNTYAWAAEGEINATIEAGFAWVEANKPGAEPTVLNWGDARLGNLLISDELGVAGILDWEMVTLGSPEQDLGWWLLLQRHHTEGIGLPLPEGFPDRDAIIARYTELTGHEVKHADFYEAFGALKLSILMHRAGNMMIAGGMLPPDAPMKFNNPASQMLAKFIGAPAPTGTAQSFIGNR
jgi:aminoglycoside phosphotransferase (APT) family kinase protein